jgi:hypothetical protein
MQLIRRRLSAAVSLATWGFGGFGASSKRMNSGATLDENFGDMVNFWRQG